MKGETTVSYSKLEVFDPPMCCSSGVCGASVDPVLAGFAGDLQWLKKQGIAVRRFNLSSDPAEFVLRDVVRDALNSEGNECLPLILADGKIVSRGVYPSRDDLMAFAANGDGE